MRTKTVHALLWCLLALAALAAAQTYHAAPRLEVVSVKHVGSYKDGGRWEGTPGYGLHYGREMRPMRYTGVRLSGELPLYGILIYAFSPLFAPLLL